MNAAAEQSHVPHISSMSNQMQIAPSSVPFIPDNAPFTPTQRAWLNGFLAGMFSRTQTGAGSAGTTMAPVKIKVSVLFGSESGNCEALAKRVAKTANQRGFEAKAWARTRSQQKI